jgi:hypothetical protein
MVNSIKTSIIHSNNEVGKPDERESVKPVTKCYIPPHPPVIKLVSVDNSLEVMASLPIRKIEIQKIDSDKRVPSAGFIVVSHRINGTILELLINSHNEIPDMKAFWDEKQSKLYLAGGKRAYLENEQPLHHIYLNSLLCNEVKQARFSIDFGNRKWMRVVKQEPALCEWQKNHWEQTQDAYDVDLFSIGHPPCLIRLLDFLRNRFNFSL